MSAEPRRTPRQLWTIQQVADFLQLPVATIRKQRIEGKFCPAYKLGKHLRWDSAEVMQWLEEHRDEE